MKRSKANAWKFVLGFVALLLFTIFKILDMRFWSIVTFIALLIAIAMLMEHTGCKHCGYKPMRDNWEHTHCPKCGKPYEEE